jgi:hypothetical protein
MLALAFVRHVWLLNLFEFFTGFAWIAVLSTLNLGAQRSAARWVKARALAVYLTVFFGSMTAGSAIWGQIASRFGTPPRWLSPRWGWCWQAPPCSAGSWRKIRI